MTNGRADDILILCNECCWGQASQATINIFSLLHRFSFNAVSLLYVDTATAANTVARTSTNTALAGSASGIVTILLAYYRTKTWNLLSICTGVLGGGRAVRPVSS